MQEIYTYPAEEAEYAESLRSRCAFWDAYCASAWAAAEAVASRRANEARQIWRAGNKFYSSGMTPQRAAYEAEVAAYAESVRLRGEHPHFDGEFISTLTGRPRYYTEDEAATAAYNDAMWESRLHPRPLPAGAEIVIEE